MERIFALLKLVDEPNRSRCYQLCYEKQAEFEKAQGSGYNHQAWEGGYIDHVAETMQICAKLYPLYLDRGVPFTLADALLVMFLHDLEKPFLKKMPAIAIYDDYKEERRKFRQGIIDEYGIQLTEQQQNAIRYVEGEGSDYSNKHRTMNELAAFCHIADVSSARIWWDRGRQ